MQEHLKTDSALLSQVIVEDYGVLKMRIKVLVEERHLLVESSEIV